MKGARGSVTAVVGSGVAAAMVALAASAATPASPLGEWIVDDGLARVAIGRCPADVRKLCGRISWLQVPNDDQGRPRADVKNPDVGRRGRSVLGLEMLSDFSAVGDGSWAGGKIYDPKSGRAYDGKMRVNPAGVLEVQGCIAVICQGRKWTRAR